MDDKPELPPMTRGDHDYGHWLVQELLWCFWHGRSVPRRPELVQAIVDSYESDLEYHL